MSVMEMREGLEGGFPGLHRPTTQGSQSAFRVTSLGCSATKKTVPGCQRFAWWCLGKQA